MVSEGSTDKISDGVVDLGKRFVIVLLNKILILHRKSDSTDLFVNETKI